MKKFIILMFVVALFATSCISQHRHIVGNGPQTGIKVERKQWYALWGLVPVGFVDTKELAGNAKDYEIYTRQNAGDFFLNILTGIVTFQSRTVTVTK
ncbi:Bor/Iss family lipoprotein [Brachyspira pilosicoli]|uniref:Lipoprotein n=1 Tax=Brachyspira pilosicoli TaxID=52584 RepID=A0A5C8F688_BRAPL|nr:hypothetical protein [Brachyspira pilosicoli]TXJ44954.1 hypothetical protein EPJ72_03155 [Brachyspira pilosicoli]